MDLRSCGKRVLSKTWLGEEAATRVGQHASDAVTYVMIDEVGKLDYSRAVLSVYTDPPTCCPTWATRRSLPF